MKLSISIQASNSTTKFTINSENSITINGETTDLSIIPNNGQADGVSPIIGTVSKDDLGEVSLTVLVQYTPSNTKWNGHVLEQKNITVFIQTDGTGDQLFYSNGNPILDENGDPTYDGTGDPLLFDVYDEEGNVIGQETKLRQFGIMDFVVNILPEEPIE